MCVDLLNDRYYKLLSLGLAVSQSNVVGWHQWASLLLVGTTVVHVILGHVNCHLAGEVGNEGKMERKVHSHLMTTFKPTSLPA